MHKLLLRRLAPYVIRYCYPGWSAVLHMMREQSPHASTPQMMQGVLRLSTMQAKDIMIPACRMMAVTYYDPLHAIIDCVKESGHSRFPVVYAQKESASPVLAGLLLAKEVLPYVAADMPSFCMAKVMRSMIVVPGSRLLLNLLNDF